MENIIIACDYGGLEAKEAIIEHLKTRGYKDILSEAGIKDAIKNKITSHMKNTPDLTMTGYDYMLENVSAKDQNTILHNMIKFSGKQAKTDDLKGSSLIYDLGTYLPGTVDRMDAVDAAAFACCFSLSGKDDLIILSCMTGEMMMNTAKRLLPKKILTLADTPEKAELGREHNDSQVLVIPGSIRFIPDEDDDRKITKKIIDSFLDTQFSNDQKKDPVRQRRKDKWKDLAGCI